MEPESRSPGAFQGADEDPGFGQVDIRCVLPSPSTDDRPSAGLQKARRAQLLQEERVQEDERKQEAALNQLAEMGFTDRSGNKKLLAASRNDVAAVVDAVAPDGPDVHVLAMSVPASLRNRAIQIAVTHHVDGRMIKAEHELVAHTLHLGSEKVEGGWRKPRSDLPMHSSGQAREWRA